MDIKALKKYMREIGRKGGNTTKNRHSKDYFSRISKMRKPVDRKSKQAA